jgi:hypothetical protein
LSEIKCIIKKEQCNKKVWEYCKCQHPSGAPPNWPFPGSTEYVACINDGVNKCCEVFYLKCRAGTKWKTLFWDYVEPQCPVDPAFDPYR